ncbi:unnamed protein product [Microthlaspi erraticum]|uniref:Arabidopsis retrotransposon Orf1 C-terminal domain-containing protein n=1 Tax=Microthlaspi erraticum TaxID=1685480 RepID=A0A6D2KLL3_9BRAS|nr:unnamed protein product [Microthlaspi erraticum]
MTNSEGSRASQRRMVEGESSNARERRLKMQADLERMTQRMEESDAEDESEQGEFEIGVNLVQEEGNGSPNEEGSDETESEEEGREVNQLVDEVSKSNQDEPMEELSHKSRRGGGRTPYVPRALQCPFSMDFMDTKYPHVDTMKALGIFEDVELVLKNMHLAKLFSYHMESYKELTCEFLASMRYHMYEEEDRADLDQGLGWITFLAKGEKRMVTFRQLEILFGFNYGEGTKWNFKEKELQRVWATIADGVYSSSRSKAAQIRSPVLRSQPTTLDINEGRRLSVGGLITPILCAAGVNPTDREPLNQVGWTSSFARPTFSLSTRSWMGGSNSSSHIHWLDPPSSPAQPRAHHSSRGENIDFRPPVYTLVGHEDDLREEEPELDRAESRAEDRAEDQARRVRIWVSLSAITLRSMRLQG